MTDDAIDILKDWYEGYRPKANPAVEPERYVVCAGLAVLEVMRSVFPLNTSNYITDRNQVRTSGPLIQNILVRYGVTQTYTREGGRTTRGTRPAAESLVNRLNSFPAMAAMSDDERVAHIDTLQRWLADRVKDYFGRQRLGVDIHLEKPGPQIIGDILLAAGERKMAGCVAQHLVGAKLALRFHDANITVENHSCTTADQQLQRPGDFVIRDTVFHVTVAPMPSVLEKCRANVRSGYRPVLLVSESSIEAARQMAKNLELFDRVWITSIEAFVGQNIEEIGEFSRPDIARGLLALLETYNSRVREVEIDPSLLFEIPTNLS